MIDFLLCESTPNMTPSFVIRKTEKKSQAILRPLKNETLKQKRIFWPVEIGRFSGSSPKKLPLSFALLSLELFWSL